MKIEHYENVVVLPVINEHAGVFVDKTCIPSSLVYRYYPPHTPDKPPQIPIQPGDYREPEIRIERPAIFAGYLRSFYGVFLVEQLSRLWAVKDRPDYPIVWCGKARYLDYQNEILNILGITNEPIFILKPTWFASLLIPEPGYVISNVFKKEYADFLGVVDPAPVEPGKRGWLSRSALPPPGDKLEYEDRLEEYLEAAGWTIFHPEEHTVAEQLQFISSCEEIAGIDGSAFHSVILLKTLETKMKIIYARDRRSNENHRTIAQTKNLDLEEIALDQVVIKRGVRPRITILPNFSQILDRLGVPIKDHTPPDGANLTTAHINQIARHLQAESYLEIGGQEDNPFFHVAVDKRVVVQPRFPFDVRQYQSAALKFYEMHAHDFFTNYSHGMTFDMILLHGAQGFEQTFRDFCTSLSCAHKQTVWIINGTVEKASNQPDEMQYGDGYKVVFAIHDFFPMFSYLTLNTDNHLQTVVWQSPRKVFSPHFDSLETITRMGDSDYVEHRELMNLHDESDAWDILFKTIPRKESALCR